MPRFFLPPETSFPEDALPEKITLFGDDAFHLSVSLRARIGDEITVLSANGIEYSCKIASIFGGKKDPVVELIPFAFEKSKAESPCRITLFQGMPKGKKTDSIIQKCTELGVDKIVFVYTDRSIPEFSDGEKKENRFRKIAEEACKQCGRGKLVDVSILPSLDSAILKMKESECVFCCYESEEEGSLKKLLSSSFESAAFLIGPEGGISEREIALLEKESIPLVTLGRRILRTETAASAVLSMLLYEKEL